MRARPPRRPRPRAPRRRRRRAILAGLLLLPAILYLLRGPILYPLLLRGASLAADRFAGLDLSVEEASGNGFTHLVLRGVRLRVRDDASALRALDAQRVETTHSLWRLVLGGGGALRAVRAEGVELVLEEGKETIEEPSERFRLPASLPRLTLDRVAIRASLGAGARLDVPRLDLRDDGEALDLRAPGVLLEGPSIGSRRTDLSARLRYDRGRIRIDSLELDGETFARDSLLDLAEVGEGRVRAAVGLAAFGGGGRIEGSIEGEALEAAFAVEGVRADEVLRFLSPGAPPDFEAIADLEGSVRLGGGEGAAGEARFRLREVRLGAERLEAASGDLRLEEDTLRSSALEVVRGSNRASVASFEVPLPIRNPADLLATAKGRLEVELSDLPGLLGAETAEGVPPHRLRIEGELAAGQARIHEGALELPEGTVRIEAGRLALSSAAPEDLTEASLEVRLEADVHDLHRLGAILGTPPWAGSIRGSATLEGSVRRLRGSIDLSGDGIVAAGISVGTLRLAADGSAGEGAVRLRVGRLEASGEGGDLTLARPASVEWKGGALRVEEVAFAGSLAEGTATFASDASGARFGLSLSRAEVGGLLAPYLPESVGLGRAHASIEGSLDERGALSVESAGGVDGVRLPRLGEDLDLTWKGRIAGGEAFLEALRLAGGEEILADLEARVPLDLRGERLVPEEGEIVLRGFVRPPPLERLALGTQGEAGTISGRLQARLDLSGSPRSVRGRVDLEGEAITLEAGGSGRVLGPATLSARLVLSDALEVEALDLKSPGQFEAGAAGRVETGGDVASLLRSDAVLEAPLRLEGTLAVPDVSWLAAWTRSARRVAGSLEARVALEGTIREPRVSGSCRLAGGEARLAADVPPLEALEGSLRLEGDRVRIESLRGEMGGSPFRIEGEVAGIFGTPTLDVDLRGENLLLHRSAWLRVRADSSLRLRGPSDRLRIEGEVALRGSRFGKNVDFLRLPRRGEAAGARRGFQVFSVREAPFSNAQFSVRVTSAEPFEIRNNVATGSVRPDLLLGGTGAVPVVTGVIYVDATKASLPAGSVTVRSGTIRFEEGNPFVPVLDLNAEARIRGYDATIQVTGPYDRPEVLLSSVPPLPQRDLLLLVLAGKPPEEPVSARTGERAAQAVTLYLAQDFLERWFAGESTESQESVLERFDVQVGEITTRDGEASVEATFRMTRDVVFGKDSLYLAAEQDEYGHYNFGVRFLVRFR